MRVEVWDMPLDLIVLQVSLLASVVLAVIIHVGHALRGREKLEKRISSLESQVAALAESSPKMTQIRNNLRQLRAAADQYLLENSKIDVGFSDLVGPGRYISEIRPVMGERYDNARMTHEVGPVALLPDGRKITI